MKFKAGIEQSIYILLILGRVPENFYIGADDISNRLKLSNSYLKKLMALLRKEGLVISITGKNGGFAIAKPLSEINLSNIFDAVEGKETLFINTNLDRNMLGDNSVKNKKCSLKIVMNTIEDTLKNALKEINLLELEQKIELEYDTTNIDEWIKNVITKRFSDNDNYD